MSDRSPITLHTFYSNVTLNQESGEKLATLLTNLEQLPRLRSLPSWSLFGECHERELAFLVGCTFCGPQRQTGICHLVCPFLAAAN